MQEFQNKDSDTVKARVDSTLKKQWETWCNKVNITPSQGLRWLIHMHLSDPSKLWSYLAEQDKNESQSLTSGEEDVKD